MQVLAKGEKGKNQTRDKVTLHVDSVDQIVLALRPNIIDCLKTFINVLYILINNRLSITITWLIMFMRIVGRYVTRNVLVSFLSSNTDTITDCISSPLFILFFFQCHFLIVYCFISDTLYLNLFNIQFVCSFEERSIFIENLHHCSPKG